MTRRSPIPEGIDWLTPYLTVSDAEASMAFYAQAFGFETGLAMPGPDGKPVHAEMRYKGRTIIMMGPEGAYGSTAKTPKNSGTETPMSLYVYCDDVDSIFRQATAAGATAAMEPQDMFWGDRAAMVVDPDGYRWNFATNVADFDPANVPKPE